MHILIVEDEKTLQEDIASFLESEGFHCQTAGDIAGALEKLDRAEFTVLLIDLNLPDGDGLKLVGQVKKLSVKTGIIIISARDMVDDRIRGLEAGADDYIVKPFHLPELNARLRSLIRRISFDGENLLEFGSLSIHPDKHIAFVKNSPLDLTPREFDLLLFLVTNKNKVITRESIADYLWGDYMGSFVSYDFVYTHIKNLRKKITDAGGEDYIQNVYGVGYKFSAL